MKEDLAVLVLFNVFYFECAYRAIVKTDTKVAEYKTLLFKMLEIFRLDADDCFDMLKLGKKLPFIEKFYHPSDIQLDVITTIDGYDEDQLIRVKAMVDMIKEQIVNSILSINAVLIANEFEGDMNNASLNNNACESSFGMLDYINRTKKNLSFLFKETIVIAVKNKFFESFDRKSVTEQEAMLKKANIQYNEIIKIIKQNDATEESIKLDNETAARQARLECHEMKKLKEKNLREKIYDLVPCDTEAYDQCLAEYLCIAKRSTETVYIKSLLQLLKLCLANKKLPAKSFTLSSKNKALSVDALRIKLFKLL